MAGRKRGGFKNTGPMTGKMGPSTRVNPSGTAAVGRAKTARGAMRSPALPKPKRGAKPKRYI